MPGFQHARAGFIAGLDHPIEFVLTLDLEEIAMGDIDRSLPDEFAVIGSHENRIRHDRLALSGKRRTTEHHRCAQADFGDRGERTSPATMVLE